MAYLLPIVLVALVGLATDYVAAMLFPPIHILFAGIHVPGHAIGTVATAGQVYFDKHKRGMEQQRPVFVERPGQSQRRRVLDHHSDRDSQFVDNGCVCCKGASPAIVCPLLCMDNLIQVSPTPVTDGGMLISFTLGFLALHYFVAGNIVTKVIRSRTTWVEYIKDELIKAG